MKSEDYKVVFNSLSDGIYVTDGQGITLQVNRAFELITDISAESVVSKYVGDLVSGGIYNQSVTLKVLEKQRAVSLVETLKNGREVLLTGMPVFDSDGQVHRVVTTLRDVAELQATKQELARSVEKTERYRMELLNLRVSPVKQDKFIVYSKAMQNVMHTALQLGEVDSTVLITGESGVGKELVARAIHRAGRGDAAPLIATNCSAIPENLLESELFGYERGAFTGAERSGKPGLFEVAKGGTLFLDEIGDVSLNIQVKLLRALHEKEILRVGGRKPVHVDVRVITATNQNLEEMVEQGRFRKDLYYRLNVIPLHIPPLRERNEAILPLVHHFMEHFNRRFKRQTRIHPDALLKLEQYHWPGNVRELENTIERLIVLCRDDLIELEDLPSAINLATVKQPTAGGGMATIGGAPHLPNLNRAVAELERTILSEAWSKHRSTRKIAAALGISQSTTVRKLNVHGIGDES